MSHVYNVHVQVESECVGLFSLIVFDGITGALSMLLIHRYFSFVISLTLASVLHAMRLLLCFVMFFCGIASRKQAIEPISLTGISVNYDISTAQDVTHV